MYYFWSSFGGKGGRYLYGELVVKSRVTGKQRADLLKLFATQHPSVKIEWGWRPRRGTRKKTAAVYRTLVGGTLGNMLQAVGVSW